MRTTYIKIRPNEKTDSNKLNTEYTNVAQDIADLYRDAIEVSNDVTAHNIAIPATSAAQEAAIATLESTLGSLLGNGLTIYNFYDNDPVIYPESVASVNKATYQQDFGEVVLPVANTELEYHFINPVDGQRTVIDNVRDFVKGYITNNRFKPKINEIFESPIEYAVDTNTMKGHIARVLAQNSDIDNITMVYNLDAQEIKYINTIKVYPMPPLNTNYEDVILHLSSGIDQGVHDVNDDEIAMPMSNARKRVFRFPDKQVVGISVLLNTANYSIIDNAGTKEFIIGARLITMERVTYINTGYIGLEIDVPDGKTKIGKIVPQFVGEAENIDVNVYNSLEEFNAVGNSTILQGTAQSIQNVINTSIETDKIYILFKLTKQDNNCTPVLKGCNITWL